MMSQEAANDFDHDFFNIDSFWSSNDDVGDDFWLAAAAVSGDNENDTGDLLDEEDLSPIIHRAMPKEKGSKDELKSQPHNKQVDGEDNCKADQTELVSCEQNGEQGADRHCNLTNTSNKRKLSRDKVEVDATIPDEQDETDEAAFLLADEEYSIGELGDDEYSSAFNLANNSCGSVYSMGSDAMPHSSLLSSSTRNAEIDGTHALPIEPSLAQGATSSTTTISPQHPLPLGNADASASSQSSLFINDQDIPDMVNLFSSMYNPNDDATRYSTNPLSIMVPNPQMFSNMYQYTASNSSSAMNNKHQNPNSMGSQMDYFTPPGVSNHRFLDSNNPASIFLCQDSLSPAPKVANQPPSSSTYIPVASSAAVAAAAAAMANSAAALNTMRKLNTTYGVPIAPLQRSIPLELPLKPKGHGAPTATATITTGSGSSAKVSKISITPDISDFKLVQIFHNFCDPMSKLLHLHKFQQLMQTHQLKEDPRTSGAAVNPNSPIAQEAQSLFKILDLKGVGYIDLEKFMSSFQICNRCTEAKRRAHSALCASQGQAFVATALERQLMEDVAPVIVRVVPTQYEGPKVKSCEHYQWTWCEGFEKTGNEKCKGTNRHDKCPKYLANCTLWKHKLPPKNRKPKIVENIESPSKKLKHFA